MTCTQTSVSEINRHIITPQLLKIFNSLRNWILNNYFAAGWIIHFRIRHFNFCYWHFHINWYNIWPYLFYSFTYFNSKILIYVTYNKIPTENRMQRLLNCTSLLPWKFSLSLHCRHTQMSKMSEPTAAWSFQDDVARSKQTYKRDLTMTFSAVISLLSR